MLNTITRIRNSKRKSQKEFKIHMDIKDLSQPRKYSSFTDIAPLTEEQLDYAIQCAKEARSRKTW